MKFFLLTLPFLLTACQTKTIPETLAVAHAGGGIDGKRYTNSLEAMNHNYNKGFRLFELDLSWTSDGHLICLHDWDKTPKWLLNYHKEEPLTLNEFSSLEKPLKLTPCDIERINSWLKSHPEAYIITDIKGNNFKGLELMMDNIENAADKIIPQFTQALHYEKIKDSGFNKLIWTLYSFKGNNQDLVNHIKYMDLYAITMPPDRAKTDLAHLLNELKIPSYVHTINDKIEAMDYIKTFGLTSVYTDFLKPSIN